MSVEKFDGLPDHIQLIVVVSVVIIASAWGVIKFLKPFVDHLSSKSPTASTTDAVVISAALADSKIISDLRASIDRNTEVQEKSNIILSMLYEALVKLTLKL